jgi:ribosome-binding ATPase
MRIGILGLAASGRTTLLSSFMGTGLSREGARLSSGIVNVPDKRLDKLSEMYKPQKTTYTTVTFEDTVPLNTPVKQDKIRLYDSMKTMDAFILLVGAYRHQNPDEVYKELEKLRFELIINDLDFITKRKEKLEREIRIAVKDRALKQKEMELVERLLPVLEREESPQGMEFSEFEEGMMSNYSLMTIKPMLYVLNYSPENAGGENPDLLVENISKKMQESGITSPVLAVNALLEAEVAAMEENEIREFMEEFGISELGRDRVIKSTYELLNLITFFTVGEDECRAWPLRKDGSAIEAAGKIHTDLARGFIRAEVIEYDTLLELGSLPNAKKAGKLRLEGKTYTVKDGEVVHVMFNI